MHSTAYSWGREAGSRCREPHEQADPGAARRELAAKKRDRKASALQRQNLQVVRVEEVQACVGRARAACTEAAALSLKAAEARRRAARRRAAAAQHRLQGAGDLRQAAMHRNAALALREKELELDQAREQTRDGAWALADRVVQVLYGVGMTLQASLVGAQQRDLRDHLEQAVGD